MRQVLSLQVSSIDTVIYRNTEEKYNTNTLQICHKYANNQTNKMQTAELLLFVGWTTEQILIKKSNTIKNKNTTEICHR